jgi:protein FrlC
MAVIKREQIAGMNIHYLQYSLDYFLDSQKRIGFKSLEFWGGAPHFWMDYLINDDCRIIRQKAEDHDLKIAVFTPECAIYQYLLCASDPWQHEKSIEYFKRGLNAASVLGAKIMGINTMGGLRDENPERTYERAVKSLSILGEAAKNEGIALAVETVRPEESTIITTLPELNKLFTDVNHSNVKILLDLIAMGVAGETPEQWFKTFGENIIHIHFVDGRPSGHLIWGDGLNPLEHYVQVLNDFHYSGYLGQEITDFKYFLDPAAADAINFGKLNIFCNSN